MHEELRRSIRLFILSNPPPTGLDAVVEYVVDLKSRFYSESTLYHDILTTILNTSGLSLADLVEGGFRKCSSCREYELQKKVASKCREYERTKKIQLLGN